MNQLPGLLLDRGHHLGMAMPRCDHGDPRREIEELISIDVGNDGAPSAFRHQRIVARIRRRNHPVISLHNLACFRAGQIGDDVWQFHFLRGNLHVFLPELVLSGAR